MDASEPTPPEGENVSVESAIQPDAQPWACRYCGNLLFRADRPTRCLYCRRGEVEDDDLGHDRRLFQPVAIVR